MRVPPSSVPTTEMQRELARQTAEKIDQIESEMIAAALPVPPAPKRVQQRIEAARATPERGADASNSIPLEPLTNVAIASAVAEDFSVGDAHLAPELEEAAILYANGQDAAAAAALAAVLTEGNPLVENAQGWMMLLDIYQVLVDKEAFEHASIQYAARFEQSPPAWRGASNAEAPVRPATTRRGGLGLAVDIKLDASFDKSFQLALRAQQAKRLVAVDLTAVRQADVAGISLLLDLIRRFKAGSSMLTLTGASSLFEVLKPMVQAGRREEGEDPWMLALELLRVQSLRTEFDDLSIDYCVTFEVSPPSWEPMPEHVRETSAGDPPLIDDADATEPAEGASTPPDGASRGFRMSGELTGRMQKELGELREYAESRARVVIDCRDLARLDFVAAGELLNEVLSLRSNSKEIVFTDVSAIVSALLSVMGIHEMAEIRKRRI